MISNTNEHSGFYCFNSYCQVFVAYTLVFAAFCYRILIKYRVCTEYTE